MGWSVVLNCALALVFAAVVSLGCLATVPLLGWPWGAFVAVFVTAVGVLTVSSEGEES